MLRGFFGLSVEPDAEILAYVRTQDERERFTYHKKVVILFLRSAIFFPLFSIGSVAAGYQGRWFLQRLSSESGAGLVFVNK